MDRQTDGVHIDIDPSPTSRFSAPDQAGRKKKKRLQSTISPVRPPSFVPILLPKNHCRTSSPPPLPFPSAELDAANSLARQARRTVPIPTNASPTASRTNRNRPTPQPTASTLRGRLQFLMPGAGTGGMFLLLWCVMPPCAGGGCVCEGSLVCLMPSAWAGTPSEGCSARLHVRAERERLKPPAGQPRRRVVDLM